MSAWEGSQWQTELERARKANASGAPVVPRSSPLGLADRVVAIESRLDEIAKSLAALTPKPAADVSPRLRAEMVDWYRAGLDCDAIAEQYPWLTAAQVWSAIRGYEVSMRGEP